MGNYVIEVGNYVIATPSELGNYKIADTRKGLALARPRPFPVPKLSFAVAEAEAVDGCLDHRRSLAVGTRQGGGVDDPHRVIEVPGSRGADQPEAGNPPPYSDIRLKQPPRLGAASIEARASAFITYGVLAALRAPAIA